MGFGVEGLGALLATRTAHVYVQLRRDYSRFTHEESGLGFSAHAASTCLRLCVGVCVCVCARVRGLMMICKESHLHLMGKLLPPASLI